MPLESIHNETSLVNAMREGDKQAFTELYHYYSEQLYYNILKMVKDDHIAEELVQDIFAHIWQRRALLPPEVDFAAYLFVASRNRVYNFFKGLYREHALYTHIKEIATSAYDPVETALLAKENAHLLRKAIESLPPQRRRAFELCKIEGLSYQAASEIMGVSLSTIKDYMAHARESLRIYFRDNPEMLVSVTFFLLWQ